MDNLEAFQTLLEIIVLILTISLQYPSLGIIAVVAILFLLLTQNSKEK